MQLISIMQQLGIDSKCVWIYYLKVQRHKLREEQIVNMQVPDGSQVSMRRE